MFIMMFQLGRTRDNDRSGKMLLNVGGWGQRRATFNDRNVTGKIFSFDTAISTRGTVHQLMSVSREKPPVSSRNEIKSFNFVVKTN